MIKNIFIVFHSLTMFSAVFTAILFLVFFSRTQESINLIIFVPALIVSGVLILNSYSMYRGQFSTGYFTAMRVITIIGGLFAIFAMLAVAQSFAGPNSGGGAWKEVLFSLAALPQMLVKDPQAVLIFGFPIFAAITAITSFCF